MEPEGNIEGNMTGNIKGTCRKDSKNTKETFRGHERRIRGT
jgi:hypothetical protein